ncbi:MAG: NlpC/P60 family protein [Nitriliruptoraceae bacterium]
MSRTGTPTLPRTSVSLFIACALALSLTVPATAEPTSDALRDDLAQVEDRYAQIDRERGQLQNTYNDALERRDEAEALLVELEAELASLTERAEAMRESVGDHLRLLHKLGPSVELSALVSAGPNEAELRSTTLRQVLDRQSQDLETLAATNAAIAAAETRQAEVVAVAEERTLELEQRNEELEELFAETADEVTALEARLESVIEREEEAAARRAAAEQRQAATNDATSTTSGDSSPAPSTRASVDVAVQTALAQLGKPYRWGGNGPGSFDCSGLVVYSFRAAGITSLPRSSSAQYGATARISRSELRPGDLVFYHSPISHVAIYIGDGKVVEAPNSGSQVRIRTDGLTRSGVVGYGRVR